MKIDGFSNVEVQQSMPTEHPQKHGASQLGSNCYIVKSSLGTFIVFIFLDALSLAKQIVINNRGWALINI